MNEKDVCSYSKSIEKILQEDFPEVRFQLFLANDLEHFKVRRIGRISFDIELEESLPDSMAAEIGLFWKKIRNEIPLELEDQP
jgi:hypothetical protein